RVAITRGRIIAERDRAAGIVREAETTVGHGEIVANPGPDALVSEAAAIEADGAGLRAKVDALNVGERVIFAGDAGTREDVHAIAAAAPHKCNLIGTDGRDDVRTAAEVEAEIIVAGTADVVDGRGEVAVQPAQGK